MRLKLISYLSFFSLLQKHVFSKIISLKIRSLKIKNDKKTTNLPLLNFKNYKKLCVKTLFTP